MAVWQRTVYRFHVIINQVQCSQGSFQQRFQGGKKKLGNMPDGRYTVSITWMDLELCLIEIQYKQKMI